MPSANPIITSFNAGELSPKLRGRPDYERYFAGCERLENMIALPHGPATRRSGTYYVASSKYANHKARLVKFQYSTTQAYILEFGHLYIRFYKDDGQITSTGTPVEVTTTYDESDLFELNFCQSADLLFIAHSSYEPKVLVRTSHTVWTLSGLMTSPSGTSRTFLDGPYLDLNAVTTLTLTPSHTTGSGKTITASAAYFTNDMVGAYFRLKHSTTWGWCQVKAVVSDVNITVDILADFGATTPTADWREGAFSPERGYPSAVAIHEERLIWGGTTYQPSTLWASQVGSYYEHEPDGTNDADAWTYTLGEVTKVRWLMSDNYLVAGTPDGPWRIGGATSGEPVTPTSINARRQHTLGCSTVQCVLCGDSIVYPQRQGRKVVSIVYDYSNDKYVPSDLTLFADHITEGEDSSGNRGITSIAFQGEPDPIIWATRTDGTLIGCTFIRSEKVLAWHRHTTAPVTGGYFESVAVIPGTTEDEVWVTVRRTIGGNDVRYIEYFKPREFGDKESAFFVDSGLSWDGGDNVTISNVTLANPIVITTQGSHGFSNGDLVKFSDVGGTDELNDEVFTVANGTSGTFELSGIDGTTGYSAFTGGGHCFEVAQTVSGLTHLAGETVSACVDGADGGQFVVSATGTVTLDDYYNHIHVGLPITPVVKPMKVEAGAVTGTAQGQTKRIDYITGRFFETIGARVGPDESNLVEIDFGLNADLYTGDKALEPRCDYETEGNILITKDDPLPMTVLAIVVGVTTYERRRD